jgi:hypothetical protein
MLPQVKEFFNHLDKEEKTVKRKRRVGMLSYSYDAGLIEIPSIDDFSGFINCEVFPMQCPMIWDELEFVDDTKRFCKYCNKNIYKVDDIDAYEELSLQNKCMAISFEVFEKINNNFTEEIERNLELRLKISRFFMVYRYLNQDYIRYYSEGIASYSENSDSKIKLLKKLILDMVFSSNFSEQIQKYESHGVDLNYIFLDIVPRFNDANFNYTIYNIYKDYLEKEKN